MTTAHSVWHTESRIECKAMTLARSYDAIFDDLSQR